MIAYIEDLCEILPKPWAVVGNGSAHFKIGNIINSFPTVVRFNEYVISGYEEYVGTKTTLRSVVWEPKTQRPVPMISPFIPSPFTDYWCISERNKSNGMCIVRPKKPIEQAGMFITSGYALLSLLNREKIETTVFHMDGLQSGHYWDKSHKHWDQHNGIWEWKDIQQMPYIRIYTNNTDDFEQV